MKCAIRQWQIEDADELAAVINNPKILDNLRDGIPYPYTIQDALSFISQLLSAEEGSIYSFAITVEGRVVGSITALRQTNIHHRTAEIGYYIAESYWGKGVGTRALQQACEFILEQTNIIRIFAQPFASNVGSCKMLEKCGFVCEGTLRKNALKNGQVMDMKMYALVKE